MQLVKMNDKPEITPSGGDRRSQGGYDSKSAAEEQPVPPSRLTSQPKIKGWSNSCKAWWGDLQKFDPAYL